MEMTIQEVKQLDKNSYQIIDIRDDNEIAHGVSWLWPCASMYPPPP